MASTIEQQTVDQAETSATALIGELQREVQQLRSKLLELERFVHSMTWRGRWRRYLALLVGAQLNRLVHYSPRPLRLPRRYYRLPPLPQPPPSFSIVTPSYNQGRFLEATIRSVLDQNYPALEYVIQDGGSTDQTAEILARYRHRLHAVESGKDRGQAHAINKGFQKTTNGQIMAWLNSDDLFLPGTLHYVAAFFACHPDVDVVYGHRIIIDTQGREVGRWVLPPHSDTMLQWADYVPQETLFWRRRLWERVGGLDESFQFALDWDLLLRFREAGARFVRLPRFLGAFRVHAEQKTTAELASKGTPEMDRLRQRLHGRPVTLEDIRRHMRSYMIRHVLYNRLYQLGLYRI
ncbi:MAG: glycosyltransferase family 2 protein [Thermogemmata sp.]|nr:glycosyltransferase family 2 protein [Thermogemmata sp.]